LAENGDGRDFKAGRFFEEENQENGKIIVFFVEGLSAKDEKSI
jgi:hypothetical protein